MVGKFHFPADFVVVDYVVDPRVPLILGRPFFRTARALIDVYDEELTLRVSDKAITFKDSSDNSESGNPTPTFEPIIAKSSPSLTPFEGGYFILQEIEAYCASDSVLPGIDDAEFDPEGDISLIEEMLNNDLYSPLRPMDLKCEELKSVKSLVNEPPKLEFKDLPSHLDPRATQDQTFSAYTFIRSRPMTDAQASLYYYGEEKCIALLRAEEKFLKVKQALEEEQNQPEIIQELLLQLIHDLQLLNEIQPKQAEEKGINKQVQKKQEEKSIAELLAEEQAARINALFQNHDPPQSFICQDDDNDDDDYDKESIISMNADMFETPSSDAITTSSPIEEPKDSLIMEDEDIDTIPEKESGKDNESSAENLVQNPSESEATSDNESECDLPIFDDSPLDVFEDNCVIFSRPLFDSYGDSTSSEYSSDNESFLEEDVFSNLPFEFDIESISSDVNPIYDEVLEDIDGTNYLIDSIIDFSPKIDPLLEEFAGELALINPIPPGIAGADFDPEGDIILVEKMIMTLMEEIDIFLAADDSIPPGINSDGYDSEEDNLFLEYEPDPGELTRVVMEDIFGEPRVHMPNVLPTYPTLCPDLDFTLSTDFSGSNLVVSFPFRNRNKTFDPGISIEVQSKRFLSLNKFSISFISDPLSPVLETLLPFSSEIEDKVFNPGILVSKEEKSPHLLSHQGFKAFKIIHNFLDESPMMIYGGDIPIWDVLYLHFYPP
ncbi:reverse transcriptase domain-containing protein [Tanacetum coccineum]